MQNIALPKKIEFKDGAKPNEGIVTVEPLFPGYGMTLGNSLRRVLLSSLPGVAVVGVKIKGASHEFMALPHIKEDVLEMVLNLKQLRLKVFTEEEVRLILKVKGKKTVTAADITKNADVEIKNPTLVLANITDESGSLEMEIFVKEGRGYRIAEGAKKDSKEISYIEIDSVFSPVLLAKIDVENTRVGKMTNWDKLILEIRTDGTITPEEAFKESVKVLVNQYTSLLNNGDQGEGEVDLENLNPPAAETAIIEEVVESKPVTAKSEVKEKVKKAKK